MITESLSTLRIHRLTQAQYDKAVADGNIETNALYLTPRTEVDLSSYAKLSSPNFTGVPTAPTAAIGTNSTQIATTAFVVNAVADATGGGYSETNPPPYPVTSVNTKTGAVTLTATDVGAQPTITGGATTITSSNLTTNRALVSNGSGKVAVSAVTSTELGYLDGVTSNIQTQLNAKVPTSRTVNGKALSADITLAKGDVGLGNVDNVKQYSARNPPPYPVTSVNGQTGAVTISSVQIIVHASQPTGLSSGDFWYQVT